MKLHVSMVVVAGLAILPLVACSGGESPPARTEGARDTAIAESGLPGAAGVKKALAVSDSANARRAREDSILRADDQ